MLSHRPPIVKTTHSSRLLPFLSGLSQALASGVAALLIAGCGQTGTPLAPSLQLPTPVSDLTASRVGDRVTLTWTMPRRTTDKLPLKGLQPVQVCRRTAERACLIVGTVSFEIGKPASYDDKLPADLTSGSPQLLAYSIDVLSQHGRSAGASNIAYTAAGSAPPAFLHATGEITAKGVVLEWQPASLPGTDHKINIERTLLPPPAPPKSEAKPALRSPFGAGQPPAKQQTLVVRLPPGPDPGKSLDPDAAFDQRYSYRISRVTSVNIGAESIDISGPSSAEILIDTKDVFPPVAPTGLAAVAAPDEGAIDLSWASSTEADLAGYAVYRSESSGQPARISAAMSSTAKPIDSPAFRDATAQPGHTYAYSVTAIDRDGNESPHSGEVQETLPPKP
jgi:hypothetical protein